MAIYYNPLDVYYKSQIGAVCAEKEITFRVKGDFNSVVFVLINDKDNQEKYYQMQRKEGCFELIIKFEVGLYFYYFKVDDKFLELGTDFCAKLTNSNPQKFQLSAYSKSFTVPSWFYGGVIYQIFPDRFNIGNPNKKIPDGKILHTDLSDTPRFEPNEFGQVLNNDFFGGDLLGITKKLDYLKELGVSIIYLNPIFKAYSNHRYDTGDYMQIDPLLGDKADFINLINEADKLGIKIVLDGVFNHTGDDSLYFNKYGKYDSLGAYQSKDSKYYSWYNFINYPNEYDSWWGIKILPATNEEDESFVDFITGKDGVIEYYTKLGVAGWRLDVVDELPSEFVKKIRSATKRISNDSIVIGEVWEDASNKISYGKRREYFQGYELDSVMNYPLKNAIINYVVDKDATELSRVIKEQLDHYPHAVIHALMNILSTHDTYRLLTAVGGDKMLNKTKFQMEKTFIHKEKLEQAKFNLKVATLLQFTLFGVPSIYYGDEIGMQGYADPLNRKFFEWGNIDHEIRDWYVFLGKLRNSYELFKDGEFTEVFSSRGAFAFKREKDDKGLLIAVNIGNDDVLFEFDGELTDLISNEKHTSTLTLKKDSFLILANCL